MDFYPLNLVLAVAVASATIFLGFLPTRNIRSEFFARQVIPIFFVWACIALASPAAIRHYHFIIAFLCFASWWQFHRDHALSGKMWLSIASGLGISIGVMLILAVTPRAYPAGLSELNQTLLLTSIYLGGSVIGLAYVCYALIQGPSGRSGVTQDQIKRYVGLLVGLVLARAGVLLALLFLTPEMAGRPEVHNDTVPETQSTWHLFGHEVSTISSGFDQKGSISFQTLLLLGLVVMVFPALAFIARWASRSGATTQAVSALIGLCFGGILAETLARLLVL